MKILFCTNVFQTQAVGPAKFANFLLQINQKFSTHELRILTEDCTNDSIDKIYTVTIRSPKILRPLGSLLHSYFYNKEAAKIRQDFNFDIIVYNNIMMSLWSHFFLPKIVGRIGFINDDNNISIWNQKRPFKKRTFVRLYYRILEKLSCRLVHRIITNSNYMVNHICKEYGVSPRKIYSLYKGIDLKDIQTSSLKAIDYHADIKIIFVKNDWKRGGLKELIKALDALQKYNFSLTVIGPGQTQKKMIEDLCANIENIKLNFIGIVNSKVVFEHIKSHDILCIPSQKEALGVANIEGLAHGIPVVTTDVGGISEVTNNGKHAWISKPNNPEALAQTINECLESPEERKQKSIEGRKYVEQHFNHETMLENFIQILETIKD